MSGAITILEPIARETVRPTSGRLLPPQDPTPSRGPGLVLIVVGVVVVLALIYDFVLPRINDGPGISPAPPVAEVATVQPASTAPGGIIGPYPLTWSEAPRLDTGASAVNDAIVVGGVIVAVGRDGPDAAVWITDAAQLDYRSPGGQSGLATDFASRELLAIAGDASGLIAVGSVGSDPAVWLADSPHLWELVPPTTTGLESGVSLLDVARLPTGAVAAIAASDIGTTSLWSSPDGRSWSAVGLGDEVDVARVVGVGGGFIVVGSARSGDRGVPAIWRSDDGRSWRRAEGVGAGWLGGAVADVTSTTSGLVAVGVAYIGPDRSNATAAVWHSDDGQNWRAMARGDTSLEPAHIEIKVISTDPFADGWSATIDGPAGRSRISSGTLAPNITVESVSRRGVSIRVGAAMVDVRTGDRFAVGGSRVMTTVTSIGSRLVAMGLEMAPGSTASTPLLWVSENAGADWQVSAIVEPRLYDIGHLVAFRDRLVIPAHGESTSASQLWVARPDTTVAQSGAIDVLTSFADLINRGDSVGASAMLVPTLPPGEVTGSSTWPLLSTSLQWWRLADGRHVLDTASVDEFVASMFATSGSVTLSRCSAAVTAFPTETAAVVCHYTAEGGSRSPGATATSGRLFATLVDGRIATVTTKPDEPAPTASTTARG